MAHQHPRPVSPAPPQAVLPQVLVQVTPTGQLRVQSNLPSPGAWPQIVRMLLVAVQQAHEEEINEVQQAGERSRIVVPQGVVVG